MSSQQKSKSSSTSNKKSLEKLIQCKKCSVILYGSPNSKNNDNQSNKNEHECFDLNILFDLKKFFLFQNLIGLNSCEHSKELIKDLAINKEYLIDYAFMHPSIMKHFKIDLGDLLLLQQYDLNNSLISLSISWPSNLINLDQISLNKINFMLNIGNLAGSSQINDSFILVSKLDKQKANRSIEIKLQFSTHLSTISDSIFFNENNNTENEDEINNEKQLILSLLKEIYLNKIVILNQYLFINYIGQRLVFQIQQIDSNHLNSNKEKDVENLLSNELDNKLNINNESEKIFSNEFVVDDIKPVKCDKLNYRFNYFNHDNSFKYFIIDKKTKFVLNENVNENLNTINEIEEEENDSKIKFDAIGGLEKEIKILKELFVSPFEFADLYKKIGVEFSKGVLLYGPGGCGKTMVARAICNESKCNFVELRIADIYSKNYGESEAKLKSFFANAWSKSPCIMFIDEVDTICGRRENLNLESDKRIVSLFSNLIDQSKSKNILFLCTTNKIDMIDLSLRRPGRLDKEIEIPIPNQAARYLILKKKIDKLKHSLTEEQLNEISQHCHGYVGADLEMLVQEAGLVCINRLITDTNRINDSISMGDLNMSLRKVKPSAMREITFDIPKVYWNQIGGQNELKKKLQQAIVWPITHAESFKRLNIKPPRGILMYGPPGCSKTMIAKALATETGLNFIAVKGPELFSKWVGESERLVREIFRKARNAAPAIIFFDEIDAVATERSNSSNKNNNVGDRVLAQMLNEIDGVENLNEVTIVAATNRPDMIDKALMRPGRLDRIVYVKLPDRQTRKEIFEIKLKNMPINEDVNSDELSKRTEKYSGAEIAAVCNEAAFMALDDDINTSQITMRHFEMALSVVRPRTSDETISYFDSFSFDK